ncbi:class F sortase [Geodermatophilus sp. SYSU D01045]
MGPRSLPGVAPARPSDLRDVRHRAPDTRPGHTVAGAGGAVRIVGAYPPPLPSAQASSIEAELEALLARPPRVTRYGQPSRRAVRSARPRAARVWGCTSAVLAAAGIAAIVALPQGANDPVRLDVPLAVVAPPVPATATPSVPTAELASATVTTPQLPASTPTRVQIPALGVASRIMELGLERDGSMEVPPGAYPVGWYDGSPTPGQLGPAVLAGHVDWEGKPGAFYGLRELRPGDTVVVDRADGTVATFRVDRVEEHAKDDFPTEEVYGDIDHAGLRLITCGGAFDEDSGDYEDNIIVFASLAAVG